MEHRLSGKWRTYKVFFFSGRVEKHNDATYYEISVDEEGALTVFHAQSKRHATVCKAEQWKIESLRKRWYLYLGKKQAYEIITLETEDLVLTEVVTGERLFFAKMPGWYQRIEPVVNTVRQVNPGTKTENR